MSSLLSAITVCISYYYKKYSENVNSVLVATQTGHLHIFCLSESGHLFLQLTFMSLSSKYLFFKETTLNCSGLYGICNLFSH